jgi:hypothetical protein
MADESLQTPDEAQELLQPDTEIPVKLDSLEADGTRPKVGDQVDVKISGTVKSIENDCAYVLCDQINDTDLEEILAEHQQDWEGEDAMMRRMASQADQQSTPLGGSYG